MSAARELKVNVISDGRKVALSPWGGEVPIRSEIFEGSVFFTHRPPKGSSFPYAHPERLEGKGCPDWLWEVQLHGRFLRAPRGQVYLRAELREKPMQLGLVSRAFCRAILKFIKTMAQRRGGDIDYSFGELPGETPSISVPLKLLDRLFISDKPHSLPVDGDSDKGTWQMVDGKWESIKREAMVASIDPTKYVTVVLATSYIDWSAWCLASIPGLGSLSLDTFWGEQGAWFSLCDSAPDGSDRQFFAEIGLEAPKVSRETLKEAEVIAVDYANARLEQEVADDAQDSENAEGGSSDDLEIDEAGRQSTPYLGSDDEDDMCPDVPLERNESGRPPSSAFLEAGLRDRSASKDAKAEKQLEEKMSTIDKVQHLNQLHGSIASSEQSVEDEAGEDDPESAARLLRSPSSPSRSRRPSWATSVTLPWYLCTASGELWWCISTPGKLCWRRAAQLRELCEALAPGRAQLLSSLGSVQDMELSRHRASRLLAQLPRGALEEFTREDVKLSSLLGEDQSLAFCEAEGRIVEHRAVVGVGDVVRWRGPPTSSDDVVVELAGAFIHRLSVAGSPGVALTTAQRQFVFVARSEEEAAWLAASLGRSASSSPVLGRPWRDRLRRWPAHRVPCNDWELCFKQEEDPLGLSAQLLRFAVQAQSRSQGVLKPLNALSTRLKRLDLSDLTPQDLWCFWVNVYHSLLVHACALYGPPRSVRHIIGFHNNCSYIVAGHLFSLAEIEHCVLRHSLSPAKTRMANIFLKIWRRSDAELEERPCLRAPPLCPASAFRCRPDWRLNLVLSAGNAGSSNRLPLFERSSPQVFDALVERCMAHTLRCTGRVSADAVELPYTLYRWRGDAPAVPSLEGHERLWAAALAPLLGEGSPERSITYRRSYKWAMLERLELL